MLLLLLLTTAVSLSGAQRCIPTDRDYLGPYYYRDAQPKPGPQGLQLICRDNGAPDAVRIRITGRVLSSDDCQRPVPNARLDLWQANQAGTYSMCAPLEGGLSPLQRMECRSVVMTDSRGAFQIDTIYPASYGQGDLRRPRHIHAVVTAQGYKPLVTQMYFASDEYLNIEFNRGDAFRRGSNARDAASFYASRGLLANDTLVSPGRRQTTFDFYLRPGVNYAIRSGPPSCSRTAAPNFPFF